MHISKHIGKLHKAVPRLPEKYLSTQQWEAVVQLLPARGESPQADLTQPELQQWLLHCGSQHHL